LIQFYIMDIKNILNSSPSDSFNYCNNPMSIYSIVNGQTTEENFRIAATVSPINKRKECALYSKEDEQSVISSLSMIKNNLKLVGKSSCFDKPSINPINQENKEESQNFYFSSNESISSLSPSLSEDLSDSQESISPKKKRKELKKKIKIYLGTLNFKSYVML